MPYSQDQVIAAVTDYYDFLTRLHVKPEDIRRPPQGGWPEISQEQLSKLGRTDKVINLLKHLPYVQNDYNSSPIHVWSESGCCDYTGWQFQQEVAEGGDASYYPNFIEERNALWEKLRKPYPHIVALAAPSGKYGDYIMCDTEDGECVIWSFWDKGYQSFSNAEECFSRMKRGFIDLELFPTSTETMRELEDGDTEADGIKRIARETGWPTDEFDWHKFTAATVAELEDYDPGLGEI